MIPWMAKRAWRLEESGEEANIHYSLWSFPSLTWMVGSPVNEEGKFSEVTVPPVFSSYNLPLNGGFWYSLHLPEGEHDKVSYRRHYAASFAYLRCSACSFDLSAPKLASTFPGNSTHLSRVYLNTPSSVRYLPPQLASIAGHIPGVKRREEMIKTWT